MDMMRFLNYIWHFGVWINEICFQIEKERDENRFVPKEIKEKMRNKNYKLYETINKYQGSTVKELVEKIGWSKRKIEHLIKKLYKDGMIKFNIYPVEMKEFINWKEMKYIQPKNRG